MKLNDFIFECVNFLTNKSENNFLKKLNLKGHRSYIDSPYWIKKKKNEIMNPINNNDKCSPYDITVALNHEEIWKSS